MQQRLLTPVPFCHHPALMAAAAYTFDLPTPAYLSLSHAFPPPADASLAASVAAALAEATAARSRMTTILRANASASTGAQQWLRAVQAVDDYLPHAAGLWCWCKDGTLAPSRQAASDGALTPFGWTVSICGPEKDGLRDRLRAAVPSRASASRDMSSNPLSFGDTGFELRAAVLTQALASSNLACSATAGSDRDASLPLSAGQGLEDRLKWAVDALCRAAGALTWVSQTPYEAQSAMPDSALPMESGAPAAAQATAADALSRIVLAQAQSLAIQKLLAPVAAESNPQTEARTLATSTSKDRPKLSLRRNTSLSAHGISPAAAWIQSPLPLPPKHPAPALLAKLYLYVAGLYEEAKGLLDTSTSTSLTASASLPTCPPTFTPTPSSSPASPAPSPLPSLTPANTSTALSSDVSKTSRFLSKLGRSGSDHHWGNNNVVRPSTARVSPRTGHSAQALGPLLTHTSDAYAISQAAGLRWLAVAAGEEGNVGEALVFLQLACSTLEPALSDGNKSLSLRLGRGGKEHPDSRSSSERFAKPELEKGGDTQTTRTFQAARDELAAIEYCLGIYTRINDTVRLVSWSLSSVLTCVRARSVGGGKGQASARISGWPMSWLVSWCIAQ